MPKTLLFTWNPNKWRWDDINQAISEANIEGYRKTWSCGVTKNIAPGNRFFLMKLGVKPKGIIGSGIINSKPYEMNHWDEKSAKEGKKALYVDIEFDALADIPLLKEDVLSSPPFNEFNWYPQGSGKFIPEKVTKQLENFWSNAIRNTSNNTTKNELKTIFTEGTIRTRPTTYYERNSNARIECINHYGLKCLVCGFSFEEKYGEIGKNFIHVHHLKQMSERKKKYNFNPIDDLRPLCPNCHHMVHKRLPPYTIEELSKKINLTKKKKSHKKNKFN